MNLVKNEIKRDFLGVNGLNPYDRADSASRKQMLSSHLGQRLVISGGSVRRHQTGMEREYAKYTFSKKMPFDGEVLAIIDRYPRTNDVTMIKSNPQTIIIVENIDTKEIGMVELVGFCSQHEYFGFEYRRKKALSRIHIGQMIPAGTVLLDSPAVNEDGDYEYGVEVNIANVSLPAVSEDGILISRDFLKNFSFKTYETRVVEWGSKRFPLNIYGNPEKPDEYKPFPDIGDYVREDGLLVCLREYNKHLAIIEQDVQSLREPDLIFDKPTYVPAGGGKVIDIKVFHDPNSAQVTTPEGMEQQAEKYDRATHVFYNEILQVYRRLRKQRGEMLNLEKDFHALVKEALAYTSNDNAQRITKLFRSAPIDDWRIEFVIEYDVVPNVGFKLTGLHGDKGVICQIAERHEMPVDQDGNVADICMDGNSTIARMNLGRLHEQFVNATGRDTVKNIKKTINYEDGKVPAIEFVRELEITNPELFERVWNHLLGFYSIVSPRQYNWFLNDKYEGKRHFHLAQVLEKGHFIYFPTDNPVDLHEMVQQCRRLYPSTYGPVSYIGNSGKRRTTKRNVRIASVYMVILEKTGDDWTGVASGKLQHFGVLAPVTQADKYTQPTRTNPIRALGEAEVRIYNAYAGPYITAEIMDRNNNPAAHRATLRSILAADKPTCIQNAVNRKEVPIGGSKPLLFVKQFGFCAGWSYHYDPAIPPEQRVIDLMPNV